MTYVYILKSDDHSKTYVGSTTDLNRRLREHSVGSNSVFAKKYRPWSCVYKEEY